MSDFSPSRPQRTFIRSSMDRIRRSIRNSFRRRSGSGSLSERHIPVAGGSHPNGNDENSKLPVWSQDEASVRAGTCTFKVKYLGSVEVYESRGMQICEEALKVLRASRKRPVKGILYITGDSLRVVDKDNKGLVVDQTIEKVSFCAPDRQHEKGFAYICRDGTTRRWMCYGFHARKTTGERLSHAVGCAFAVCLEKKQKRDREAQRLTHQQDSATTGVTKSDTITTTTTIGGDRNANERGYSNSTAFQRNSFRYASLQERIQDPQNVKPAEKVPVKPAVNPFAVARPHGNMELFERQGSLRMPNQDFVDGDVKANADFRRFNSLRLNQLPSNLARQEEFGKSPISEESPSPANSAKLTTGQQNNQSYASPPSSGFNSPSSTSSPFDSSRKIQAYNSISPSGMNIICRSRGDEWLQTTASQTRFWKQYRAISPPGIANNQMPVVPETVEQTENGRHEPPSFPPPPLPPRTAITKKANTNDSTSHNEQDRSKIWTTFDEKCNLNEKQDSRATIGVNGSNVASSTFSPTNPFSHESTAVKI